MMRRWKIKSGRSLSQRAQDYESLKKSLEKDDLIDNIRSEILNRKTYEFLAVESDDNSVQGDEKKE